ncbi:hypothetical protein [Pedobacter sp. MC2016-24]|uniref:hypothetical protein n=1 Tax=Pedobacter sp. MC2016-24 TaxID=2780090 RepID=UPI00187F27A5|nr:hypothetical protein [Pedobacter sp. MC2016-24]MBE9599730.1 hypothetical protein [Pedobacter sp. MC2016-24]
MTHTTINILFYISLIVILPIGAYLMFLWGRKISKPIAKGIERSKHVSVNGIAFKSFVYMIPAIIGFFIFAIPVIYFSSLMKKEDYCIEVIRFNHLKKTDPILQERCSCLDHDELFEKAAKSQ